MAETDPFAAFNAPSAPAADDDNPFSQFDSIEPPQPKAPAGQPPAPPTPVQNMPGVSVIDDAEMRDFLTEFNAANIRQGTDKLNESRGRNFVNGLTTFLQYEAELLKGITPGAISGAGTALRGGAAAKAAAEVNAGEFQRRQLATFDRIDRGDAVADTDDPVGYFHMTPAQRQVARANVERAAAGYTPTPVQDQALYKAGTAVKEYAKTVMPAAPGYEEVWTRQVGEGLGSMMLGLPVSMVGGAGVSGLLYGAMGSGEAVERAVEFDRKEKAAGRAGLAQDDIIKAGLWGVAPGTTDILPVEMLLGRLRVPPGLTRPTAKVIAKIGGEAFWRLGKQAAVEGGQEGFQQFLQNLIASDYNSNQNLTEDILPSAGVGAGVGGVAQGAKEIGMLALRRFAGRRGGGSATDVSGQPAAPQAPTEPGKAPSSAPQAPSPGAKAPSSAPDAAPAPTIARDAAPETRAATRTQFNQYLALEERLAAIPDDAEAPPELINQAIDAEEAMVATFRTTGLPGDGLARGTRPIDSMDDVKRAFDEATPEEINEFWQGKAVGQAAAGAVAGAGAVAQGGASAKGDSAPAPITQSSPRQVAAVAEGGAKIVGDPVAAASIERLMQDKAKRLESAETRIQVAIKSARLMEKDVANLRKMHEKAQALRAGFDDRSDFRKSVDNLLFFGDPQAVRNLRADRLAGKRDATMRIGGQLQRDYDLAVREADGILQDLEALKSRRDAALGLGAPPDVTTDFLRLIATPTPRGEWAQTLGVSEDELMPHVERAIDSGLLRVDRNGVVRRNAPAVAQMEPEAVAEAQKIEDAVAEGHGGLLAPGAIEGENVTLTPKALSKIQELQAIVEEATAKILPRDVRIEVVDNIKIAKLSREDELLSLRETPSFTQEQHIFRAAWDESVQSLEELVVRGFEGEEPAAVRRASQFVGDARGAFDQLIGDYKAIIDAYAAGDRQTAVAALRKAVESAANLDRLDDSPRARLFTQHARAMARKHLIGTPLLSLRSSKSAKVTEGTEGESDELQTGSGASGQAGDDTSQSADAGALAATVGGGGASGASVAEGRILRQESATLRDDGSVFAGRVAGTERPADAGARDGRESQPFGRTEAFAAPAGYTGYVTADAPFSHARLDAIGAPKSQYRLATLTYRIYHEGTRLPNPNADPRAQLGSGLIHARISQHMDGTWEVAWVQRLADPDVFPKNMSDLLYAAIEKDLGVRLSPSGLLSPAGLKMWQRRSPESVKWHQWSKREGYFVSPRRVKDNLAKIGMDLADIAARPDSDPDKAFARDSAMAERKELIKLWTKLPLEARGATPNTMFSLRGFHSSPFDFDQFDFSKIGTGEGVQAFGWGGYFADSDKVSGHYAVSVPDQQLLREAREAYSEFDDPDSALEALLESETLTGRQKRFLSALAKDEWFGFDYPHQAIRAALRDDPRNWDASQETLDAIKGLATSYEVRINAESEDFIDWDAPLMDQPVLKKLALMHFRNPKADGNATDADRIALMREVFGPKGWAGADYYKDLARQFRSDKAASDFLAKHGIAGIRYFDRASRKAGEGTRNTVVFDDKLVEITHKDGKPVTGEERRDAVDAMFSLRDRVGADLSQTKIVDETGRPLRLYHGTGEQFEDFDLGKSVEGAVFLSLDRSIAGDYTFKGDDPKILELYADIRNPKIIDAKGENFADAMLGKPTDPDESRFSAQRFIPSDAVKDFGDYRDGYEIRLVSLGGQGLDFLVGVKSDRETSFREAVTRHVVYDIIAPSGEILRKDVDETLALHLGDTIENTLPTGIRMAMENAFIGKSLSRLFLKQAIEQAKAEGHDGLWMRNGTDMGREAHDQIAAFHPEQLVVSYKNGEHGKAVSEGERQDIVDELFAVRSTRDEDGTVHALAQTDPDAMLLSFAARAIEAEARATGKSEKQVAIQAARHEALEFFLAKGFIKPDEWATLTDTARRENWIDEAGVRAPYTAQFGEAMDAAGLEDLILKESIMEKYGAYERGQYQPKGAIAKVFKRIKDFLDRLRNGLKSQGFQRWEDIFQKMDAGEMRQRYEAVFGVPAPEPQRRVTSKAVPEGGRIAAMTLPGLAQNAPLSSSPAGPTPGLDASAPGSLADIQRNLRRKLGLTVARGRLDPAAARATGQAGGKLMGQFDRQTEVIRLRTLQDIDTEAHEVAHALENRYGGLAGLSQAHSAELDGVANLTGQSGLSEGFAEFFRLYLTNPPAADAHAPKFRAAFEDFLETEDAQTLQDIQEIQAQYQQWRGASSAGRITAAVKTAVPEGTWEKIHAEYEQGGMTRVGGMFWSYLEKVYKSRVDRTNPIRILVERIARQAEANNQHDLDLTAWRNPQAQARKIPAIDGVAYMDITRGVGWENAAGRGSVSLRDALATAFGGAGYEHWTPQQRDDFGAYLIARRGRWLWRRFEMDPAQGRGRMASPPQNPQNGDWYFDTMSRQRRVYLRGRWEAELTRAPDKHTRADHEQAVADLEAANPSFAIAAQMVYQFNRDLALKRYQAGLDSKDEFDYKNGTSDYVPWFRDMSDRVFAGTGISGREVQGKFKLQGSYRDFINPVEGIIRQVYDTNREVAVNKPKLLLAQLADSVQGAGRYAEIIPATRMVAQEVKVRDALMAAARQEGLPPEDAKDMIAAVAAMIGDDAVAKLFRSEQAIEGGDAILHYMDGGVLKMLQIHDDERGIARDILGFFELLNNTPAADSFIGMVTAGVRIPQRAITSSVGFLWRNLIRDAMQASILQAGYFPVVSNIRTAASNRARRARGEETWGELLTRHGGIMGGFNRTDIQQARAGRVLDLRSDSVTLNPFEKQFWKQTVNPWHEDFWKWAEWSEANARQTIARISYDRAIKDVEARYPAMPRDQQQFVALEASVHRSRDYLDYSRAGDAPSQMMINRFFMFFSPWLQGTDKAINAMFLAKDNQGRFAAAQAFRKKIAPLFNDELQFQRLTKSERDALKDAMRAWLTVAILAHTHLAMEVAFNDPDELEDKPFLERANSVSFTINGVDYRIPRGFDILNLASNAVRATYDSWWRENPTARSQFLKTQLTNWLPPLSNPILDLYIGWKHGRNNFFNSDIEQKHMAAMLPEDRYSAYTSGLARQIGEATGASPAKVEYSLNTIGADWARDILRAYDIADPNRPALKWQEYPFLRAARGLRGSRGAEEFWDLMGQDGSFTQPANSYKDGPNKGWTREDYRKFFDVRLKDDDSKAYAIMLKHYDAEQRRLHPMERAREMAKGVSAVMRDVAANRVKVPVTAKMDRKAEVSREVRAQAMEILGEINRREYRNALIAMKRPGYENRTPQPVKPYLAELKTISPEIHKALIGEITSSKGAKVYDYDRVREAWPEIRSRVLATDKRERIIETQGEVEFGDLAAKAMGAQAAGIR